MAEETTILSWNAPNWITIMLMVILGFALVGMIYRVVQSRGAAAA